jgi:hypothetical protein
MNRLLAHLDDLIASTTTPSTLDVDLRAFVEGTLTAREARARSARERTQERSDGVRDKIRAAWGRRSLDLTLPTVRSVGQTQNTYAAAKCSRSEPVGRVPAPCVT